ncbi:DUF370 domain-containing protein [Natroniella sulfidigena]|uniref:extracellular matrix regulator RemB n=1 Tax=Natroniella sulfidigena TaxID=723921 RepID=UPI00200B9911|nr:extracellular matrix/biofilm biosynthesis regulator RemA family protein [Natroniella sulfidigena]MCK8816609.1 DUF370 domain-containing protein [Natroniella sulfidigena]
MLHLGKGNVISLKDVVLIADLETTTQAKETEEFLKIAEAEGFIIDYSEGNPRSFIVTDETVYYSMISSNTLAKRVNVKDNLNCD